eukprot:4784170-Pleurochrysis_carterae.AAC.14
MSSPIRAGSRTATPRRRRLLQSCSTHKQAQGQAKRHCACNSRALEAAQRSRPGFRAASPCCQQPRRQALQRFRVACRVPVGAAQSQHVSRRRIMQHISHTVWQKTSKLGMDLESSS